jgi:hypothetical protein
MSIRAWTEGGASRCHTHAEPLSDSPVMVGDMHLQAPEPKRRGCRLPPHLMKPFPNSSAMVGGAHRQAFTLGGGGHCHTAWSHYRSHP